MSYWVIKDRDGYLLEYELHIHQHFDGRFEHNEDNAPKAHEPDVTHNSAEAARFVGPVYARAFARLLREIDPEEGQWRVVKVVEKKVGTEG